VSSVFDELQSLAAAGLLTKLPQLAVHRIRYYERLPSAFWELCAQRAEEVVGHGTNTR
jgi:hypothetical protein